MIEISSCAKHESSWSSNLSHSQKLKREKKNERQKVRCSLNNPCSRQVRKKLSFITLAKISELIKVCNFKERVSELRIETRH